MSEFCVMAEDKDGQKFMLRRGFRSAAEAEDHPVRLALWARVWVTEILHQPRAADTPPPFPWSVEWRGGFAYVVAADGRRLMSLLGPPSQREYIAGLMCDLKAPEAPESEQAA